MTNKEAIEALTKLRVGISWNNSFVAKENADNVDVEAINLAIKALEDPHETNNDLISREALKKAFYNQECWNVVIGSIIDNAPAVPSERPQSKYEFIEILARYVPNDICTYPEYKGKPYYSIHYKQNEEEFVGFGTYNPEVLSRYLKEYFMKGGEHDG